MITIRRGLALRHRRAAAQIYWDAFGAKLQLPLGPAETAIRYFERVMRPDRAIVALDTDDHLLGLAGFDTGEGGLIGGSNDDLFEIYGWTAWWRLPILSMFDRGVGQGRMIVDGIAVAPEARGQGIGGRLLDELALLGTEKKIEEIWLDVVTTNPRAKALYCRKGFATQHYHPSGFFRKLLKFDATERMIKRL